MRSSKFNNIAYNSRLNTLILVVSILCLILYISSFLFSVLSNTRPSMHHDLSSNEPTSIHHIIFGIASTAKSWSRRKEYVNMWWNHDNMRGCIFLDAPLDNDTFLDYDSDMPPICISNDTSRFGYTWDGGLRSAIRVARVVSETVALNHKNAR